MSLKALLAGLGVALLLAGCMGSNTSTPTQSTGTNATGCSGGNATANATNATGCATTTGGSYGSSGVVGGSGGAYAPTGYSPSG